MDAVTAPFFRIGSRTQASSAAATIPMTIIWLVVAAGVVLAITAVVAVQGGLIGGMIGGPARSAVPALADGDARGSPLMLRLN